MLALESINLKWPKWLSSIEKEEKEEKVWDDEILEKVKLTEKQEAKIEAFIGKVKRDL